MIRYWSQKTLDSGVCCLFPRLPRMARWLATAALVSLLTAVLLLFRSHQNKDPRMSVVHIEDLNSIVRDRTFTIMLWAHGPRMVRRFVRSYGSLERDPFQDCPVRNCRFRTDDLRGLNQSDAVLVHLHRTKGPKDLPPYRTPQQRWIFFTDESPQNTFLLSRKYNMKDYNGFFNWSMTYRSDADVMAAYGRTLKLTSEEKRALGPLPNYFKVNEKLAAVMGSNCNGRNHRWDYIHEMEKHMDIDTYGRCGRLNCPGHFTKDCVLLSGYKFYLAFENCNCREYATEKLWWNAFSKDAVPVVMGGPKDSYERMCPPQSFIHVDDFESPTQLAEYLNKISRDETAYNKFFAWKKNFKVLNEHGYFGSPSAHLCHICEALNKNHETKVYEHLEEYWSVTKDCSKPKWKPEKSKDT